MDFDDFWQDLKRLRAARSQQAANLIAWRRTPSSHRTARAVVREYGSEDSTPPRVDIVAFEQSAGHGREGRPWSSPPAAGVYASLVRPVAEALLPQLPILVPVALTQALAGALGEASGGRCRIKWPNDLVVDGAKLGGILIDASGQGENRTAVISFGINLAVDVDVFEQPHATSFGALGVTDQTPATLFDTLLSALDEALASPPEDLLERYRGLSAHQPGDRLRWRQGERTVEGLCRGFDEYGQLRLEVDGAETLVSAGSLLGAATDDGP